MKNGRRRELIQGYRPNFNFQRVLKHFFWLDPQLSLFAYPVCICMKPMCCEHDDPGDAKAICVCREPWRKKTLFG